MEPALWPTLADAVAVLEARGMRCAHLAIGVSGFEQQAVTRATPVAIGDTRIAAMAIEDLLVMKAFDGHPQDDQDTLGLLATQRNAIDWPTCLALAEQLGTAIDIDIASRLRAAREQ